MAKSALARKSVPFSVCTNLKVIVMNLYSAWYCPFAQRAWIALVHKNIPFDYIEIDPYEKSDDWMQISRGTGQVPVLTERGVNGSPLFAVPDSIRTLEFLHDNYPSHGSGLYPESPSARANVVFWTDFQGRKIIPYFYRFLKTPLETTESKTAVNAMEGGLREFISNMSREGPFFNGQKIDAVDIAFAPFALRIDIILSHFRAYTLARNGDLWTRYDTWWQAIVSAGLFSGTLGDTKTYADRLITFYQPYSEGGGQEDVTAVR